MSIDGFLTFLGFLAAGFALLDEVSKQRLILHVKRQFLWFLASFTLIGMLLLPKDPLVAVPSYYPVWAADFIRWAGSSPSGTDGTAFLLLVLWASVAIILYKTAGPTSSSLIKLSILAERLAAQERYLELVEVVKPYIPLIGRASERSLFFQKHHDWLASGGPFAYSSFHRSHKDSLEKCRFSRAKHAAIEQLQGLGGWLASCLSKLVPAQQDVSQAATDLEILLLRSARLRDFLASSRADFIIDLMKFERFSTEEFVSETVKLMMTTPNSHFFRELKLMDTSDGKGRYTYENQVILMKHFALNSEFACRHLIWKPIGDMGISIIREDTDYRNRLLTKLSDSTTLFDDPTYCTAEFFSALVANAAQSGFEDHMWLMYMSIISEELVDVHSHWDGEHSDKEFPTFAMELIYHITCIQKSWVELFKRLPDDNFHNTEEAVNSWNSASIILWAVRDYAKTIRCIVCCPHLPNRFKSDRWTSYVRLISQIPSEDKYSFLRNLLISEAIDPREYSPLGNLSAELKDIHSLIDPVLRYKVEDVEEALGA